MKWSFPKMSRDIGISQGKIHSALVFLNPTDPNPDIATQVVFPQFGCSHPENGQFVLIFPHFPKKEPFRTYQPHNIISVQYIKLKPVTLTIRHNRLHLNYKIRNVRTNLNLYICRHFSGNLWGKWENPGEIPHNR